MTTIQVVVKAGVLSPEDDVAVTAEFSEPFGQAFEQPALSRQSPVGIRDRGPRNGPVDGPIVTRGIIGREAFAPDESV